MNDGSSAVDFVLALVAAVASTQGASMPTPVGAANRAAAAPECRAELLASHRSRVHREDSEPDKDESLQDSKASEYMPNFLVAAESAAGSVPDKGDRPSGPEPYLSVPVPSHENCVDCTGDSLIQGADAKRTPVGQGVLSSECAWKAQQESPCAGATAKTPNDQDSAISPPSGFIATWKPGLEEVGPTRVGFGPTVQNLQSINQTSFSEVLPQAWRNHIDVEISKGTIRPTSQSVQQADPQCSDETSIGTLVSESDNGATQISSTVSVNADHEGRSGAFTKLAGDVQGQDEAAGFFLDDPTATGKVLPNDVRADAGPGTQALTCNISTDNTKAALGRDTDESRNTVTLSGQRSGPESQGRGSSTLSARTLEERRSVSQAVVAEIEFGEPTGAACDQVRRSPRETSLGQQRPAGVVTTSSLESARTGADAQAVAWLSQDIQPSSGFHERSGMPLLTSEAELPRINGLPLEQPAGDVHGRETTQEHPVAEIERGPKQYRTAVKEPGRKGFSPESAGDVAISSAVQTRQSDGKDLPSTHEQFVSERPGSSTPAEPMRPSVREHVQDTNVATRMNQSLLRTIPSELHVTLRTPEEGHVELRAFVKDGRFGASVTVGSPELRDALLSELPSLRNALVRQDVEFGQVAIAGLQTRTDADGGSGRQQHNQEPPRREPLPERREATTVIDTAFEDSAPGHTALNVHA